MEYAMTSLLKTFQHADFSWVRDKRVQKIIKKMPGEWYFVGGIVRDSLCGVKTYDIDITTLCSPEEIQQIFEPHFTISTIGKRFGTIAVYLPPFSFEITTARVESNCDGRWADVKQIRCFKLDSSRRDFTINALLFDGKGKIIDYHGGIRDLKNSQIKFIGKASKRIEEDYLRVLRFARFFGRYGDKNILKSQELPYAEEIKASLPFLSRLSPERIGSELTSMTKKPGTDLAVGLVNRYGIAKTLFGKNLSLSTPWLKTPEEKLAHMISAISYKSLGINRRVKHYIYLLEKTTNIPRRMAEIWRKFKNPQYLSDFLRFNQMQPQVFPDTIKVKLNYEEIPPRERSRRTIEYLEKFFMEKIKTTPIIKTR
jgi:poly(A) polymerase